MAVAALIVFAALGGRSDAASAPPDRLPPTKPTIDGDLEARELRPVFTFAARDRRTPASRIRFKCALDGATMRPCARIYRPLQDQTFGRHVLRVRAFDLAGNASPIAERRFSVVGFWDAAADFQRVPTPANPGPDKYGNTAWFYLYSPNPEHDPASYRLLPLFVVSDPGTDVWRTEPNCCGGTQVGYSFGRITMQPGTPNLGQNAILGWRSPVTSMVRLQANINANQTNCGVPANGINWSIDLGSRTLMSGLIVPGQSAVPVITTSVVAGETIYLVMNDAGDTNCDGTFTRLTIQTVPAN